MNIRLTVKSAGPGFKGIREATRQTVARAINRTLEEAQAAVRQELPQQLTFRSPQSKRHFENLVEFKREDRATPDNLHATMAIRDPKLAKFEEGGTLEAPTDKRPFAIPTSNLPPKPIPKRYYPVNLGLEFRRMIEGGSLLKGARLTKRGKQLLKGKLRTFAVDDRFHPEAPPPSRGVWQRRGKKGDSDTFLLWAYKRRIKVPKRIHFFDTARRVVRDRFAVNLSGFFAAQARRRG